MSRAPARLANLDLLRFVAVMLVMGRHMAVPPVIPGWPAWVQRFLATWERGGWVGVDLFFVLSGFLVSGLLFGEFRARGDISPGRFYLRRGLKIYPAFYVLLGASAVLLPASGWPFTGERLLAEMLFVQNYWPGLWNHTWSLAVEEHFYLLLPIVLWLLIRLNRGSATPLRPVLHLAAASIATSLALRTIATWSAPTSYGLTFYRSQYRLDSLMFGVAMAYAYHWHRDAFMSAFSRRRRLAAAVGAACFAPAFIWPLGSGPFLHTAGFTLFQAGSGLLLAWALLAPPVSTPIARFLAYLGTFSYSVYLWHNAVILQIEPLVERHLIGPVSYPIRFVLTLALALGCGVAMARLVEMPGLAIRDRWIPAPPRAARAGVMPS